MANLTAVTRDNDIATASVATPIKQPYFEYYKFVSPKEAYNSVSDTGFKGGVKGVALAIGHLVLDLFKVLGNVLTGIANGIHKALTWIDAKLFSKKQPEIETVGLQTEEPGTDLVEFELNEEIDGDMPIVVADDTSKASSKALALAKAVLGLAVLSAAGYYAYTKLQGPAAAVAVQS
ncbi:MAG: hypothetical protein HY861_04935 [Chlamydiia bacterium]|nr:hypothetical protein [Chlamydiia bacterium]